MKNCNKTNCDDYFENTKYNNCLVVYSEHYSSIENKAELCCYEYINSIKDILHFTGKGIYGLDNYRSKLHDELCELFNLDKDVTKKYTDNLDLDYYKVAEKLYLDLLKEKRLKEKGLKE
jgi:hypothetical protein